MFDLTMYPSLSIPPTVCDPLPLLFLPYVCTFHHLTLRHILSEAPTPTVDLISPIRNSIIQYSPITCLFTSSFHPPVLKDRCTLLAFVMYLLLHHLFAPRTTTFATTHQSAGTGQTDTTRYALFNHCIH